MRQFRDDAASDNRCPVAWMRNIHDEAFGALSGAYSFHDNPRSNSLVRRRNHAILVGYAPVRRHALHHAGTITGCYPGIDVTLTCGGRRPCRQDQEQ